MAKVPNKQIQSSKANVTHTLVFDDEDTNDRIHKLSVAIKKKLIEI